jgi:hypothetical protein
MEKMRRRPRDPDHSPSRIERWRDSIPLTHCQVKSLDKSARKQRIDLKPLKGVWLGTNWLKTCLSRPRPIADSKFILLREAL